MAPFSKVTTKSFYDLGKKECKTRLEGKFADSDIKVRCAALRCVCAALRLRNARLAAAAGRRTQQLGGGRHGHS